MGEIDVIFNLLPHLTGEQQDQFVQLKNLYQEWNARLNLISRKDMDGFYLRHVLHSLAIAKWTQFVPRTKILDMGTGGGFPGIPLAIVFPEADFVLMDSIGKKVRAVHEIAGTLGLSNVTALHGRVESCTQRFDFITARAVARIEKLVRWTNNLWLDRQLCAVKNGLLLLKGGNVQQELREAGIEECQLVPLSGLLNDAFFNEKYLIHIPAVGR